MSFLRICFFSIVVLSIGIPCRYVNAKEGSPVQSVKKAGKPIDRVTSSKRKQSVQKKTVPRKVVTQGGNQKPRAPIRSSSTGISKSSVPKKTSSPASSVVPKVSPSPKVTALPVRKQQQLSESSLQETRPVEPVVKDPSVGFKPIGPKSVEPMSIGQRPLGFTQTDFKPSETKPADSKADQKLVVIDPGHGGYDLGARMSACDEKSLALSTALLTKKHLIDMGYRVILTRSRDVFMPLEKRASIANETKSKLFVSIHYNAAKNTVAKGIEVFYYVSADKFRTGSSKKLAARVLNKVIDKTVAESRGIKEGNFYVIRETRMPAILIEAGFMTHPEELHLLKDIHYRDKIARGIAEGIDSFFKA